MANVEFKDNSLKVKAALNEAAIKYLYEAGGELEAQVKRTASVGKVSGGKTKNSWSYKVDEGDAVAEVGNTSQNAIWEEFGTGDYAADGRKGGWYIKIGNGQNEISQSVVDAYHMKVVTGKNGTKFAFTKGKPAKHTLQNAYNSKKNQLISRAQQIFKGLGE